MSRLISTLSTLGLTGEEIAEAIWLATQIECPPSVHFAESGAKPEDEDREEQAHPDQSSATEEPDDSPPAESSVELLPDTVEKTPSLALPPNYKPIPVRDAPAISQALQLARSLRPLARQIAIGFATVLDEMETVDQIAETGVWQPVLKPESELWLDVALVFDTSPSMCLWQRLRVDLHRLLSRYGEFRDVRVWRLQPTAAGGVNLISRNGTVHKPQALLTGDRRRLVVIVSDCVGSAWHNGTILRDFIQVWSAALPTVVFQVFPERLWARTALARSVTVEFQGKRAGLPNQWLQPVARSYWDREQLAQNLQAGAVRLPVVALEPEAVSSWANVVVGDRRSRTLGIVWAVSPVAGQGAQISSPSSPSASSPSSLSPTTLQDRIDSFLLLASPTARQLAGLLASAPVITLPIVRLIKQSMLPTASAVHLAEVLMSGLLKVSGSQVPTFANAERIAYQLADDQVGDCLRAGSLVVDALTVLEKVSTYVAQGLGKSVSEFRALLRTPGQGQGSPETEFLNAFAIVTAKILRGLGSEFAGFANAFAPPEIDSVDAIANHPSFPPLEPFSFIDVRLEDRTVPPFPPPLQTETFTVLTFQAQSDPEVARQQLEWIDHLIYSHTGKHLSDLERRVFIGSWHGQTYEEIYPENPEYIEKYVGYKLWQKLSKALGEKVTKKQFLGVIDRAIRADNQQLALFEFTVATFQRRTTRQKGSLKGPRKQPQSLEQPSEWIITTQRHRASRYIETLPEQILLEMVAIPSGRFLMGSPDHELGRDDAESPQHEVTVSQFFMGRYPVTQAQWRVVANLPQVGQALDPDPSCFQGDRRPVEQVSWYDAVEFCARLSTHTGHPYRLPSEAEWEYACRANTSTHFHFGDMITTQVANYNGNAYADGPSGTSRDETTPVDEFAYANAFGLSDMHGNVWEWCQDHWHKNYKGAPPDGRAWLIWLIDDETARRVIRGGSWDNNPRDCRSASRDCDFSNIHLIFNLGFRVCCSAPRTL